MYKCHVWINLKYTLAFSVETYNAVVQVPLLVVIIIPKVVKTYTTDQAENLEKRVISTKKNIAILHQTGGC